MSGRPRRALAISGSLRAGATNTALLEAARLVAPDRVDVTLYEGLAGLPAFNPDLDRMDGVGLPPAVADLRARIAGVDGVLLSSPEYAHGVAGALKNLLDWLVGSTEFHGKPVAVLTASSRALHAPAQLREVLATMNVRVVDAASLTVDVPRGLDGAGVAAHPEVGAVLRTAVGRFVAALG
ncbi:MAG: NADPH-dependent FMN reductase [Gemmatimonadaceae bacterium]